jgi:integrase
MPRRASNNPRQIRIKSCNCALCAEQFRPGTKPTRKDCTGPWQARFRDAAGIQKAKNKPTLKEAEALLDKNRSNVRDRTYLDTARGQIKLKDWHAKWLVARRGERTTTTREDTSWKCHVEPEFGGWKLLDISHMDVDTWIAKLTKKTGAEAVTKAFRLLNKLMSVALRDRRIPYNPCDGVVLPKPAAKHPDDLAPPTYEQLAAVRTFIPRYYHPLLVTEEESGLRWGELVGLRMQWVDFADGLIQVREVIVETSSGGLERKLQPKTSAGFRSIPLTGKAADAIRTATAGRTFAKTPSDPAQGLEKDELVFLGPRKGVLSRNNFRRLWIPAIKSTGIARTVKNPVTKKTEWWPHVHDIRHAFASRLHDEGVSEANVQKILGHERGGKVTWLYQHASAEAVESVRKALDPRGHLRVVASA